MVARAADEFLRDHLAEIEQACAPERLEATLGCLFEAHRRAELRAEQTSLCHH